MRRKGKKAVKQRIVATRLRKRPSRGKISWLEETTGKSQVEWVKVIQQEIKRASRPSRDPKHDRTDPLAWIGRLARVVHRTLPRTGRYDSNLRMAAILGHVLLLWYFRCHRAKCYDPRRPIAARQAALAHWTAVATAVFSTMLNESEDRRMFPGQKWESPFAWHATDGTFV